MKPYKDNIESQTIKGKNFREVLFTGEHLQLTLMSLEPGEDIGKEIHPATDQFFRFEEGKGQAIIDGVTYALKAGDAIIVPQGSEHNVMNTSKIKPLKLYTIYSKQMHPKNVVEQTKLDALDNEDKKK
jgi:mannose-6-phosphate isomerase-like protein (cupin superfamily)